MMTAALLDVDGTLIDTNLLHVLAWRRAFQRLGKQVPASAILYKVGMGGDRLAPEILGDDGEAAEKARAYHAEEYSKKGLIDCAEALPGAAALLEGLRSRGVKTALATSAKKGELDGYLKLLGGRGAVDALVTQEQVETTKPAPDIFARALEALGVTSALVIGDTVYDIRAAKKLGLPCVAVLSGGIERELLIEAGAAAIYDSAAAVLADLDQVLQIR
jgi:membrane protein